MRQLAVPISLLALLPIFLCYTINVPEQGIIVSSPFEPRKLQVHVPDEDFFDISGCSWFGKAPFCKGKCPKGWNEIRAASNRYYSLLSIVPTIEKEFGQPCLPGHMKSYCCKTNYLDPTWSGRWISADTGAQRICHYDVHGKKKNELGNYCGSLSCETVGDGGKEWTTYEIIGGYCNFLETENGKTGRGTNGSIEWHSQGKEGLMWIKHRLPDPLPEFEYE